MNTRIIIRIDTYEFEADLFDSPTGRAIIDALPFRATVNTWGDEIYFAVPANAALETGAVDVVQVGDLAYWPSMPAFCIFFGPTPVSRGSEPRAASPVNVFGRLTAPDPTSLRKIPAGAEVLLTVP